MTDLLSLAGRVEAAMGADRELDALVCEAVGAWSQRGYDQRNGMRPRGAEPLTLLAYLRDGVALNYSSSIDAAMTLVDERWQVALLWDRDERTAMACVGPNALAGFRLGEGEAKGLSATDTKARALVAAALRAALRARAAQGEG